MTVPVDPQHTSARSDEMSLRADHVAIAVPQIDDALAFFERHFPIDMGWKKTLGYSRDFHWCDFYIGPFKIELIEPLGDGSFVSRFLAKRGPGLHHWSFEIARIEALLARLEADGLRIVDRFEMGDEGLTAFISPRSAHGVLIQFWKVPEVKEPERPSSGSHRLRSGETVRMRVDHVAIAVRDIEATLSLYERYFPFQLRRPPHLGWDGTFLVASFYVNGYKVELIQNAAGKSGFVERFISERGEGLHHIAIDVDRLDPYVAELEADGVRIVDPREVSKGYKTAFISPRSAHGVLIQLWESPEFRS
jgi:methylmalonyl-CoA/ethylmalonyl-CoA epimerase